MAIPENELLSQIPDSKNGARISARVSLQVKETIDLAAELTGATANQFMAQAAYQAAKKLIEEERIVRLSNLETSRFLDLLDNPPAPNENLKKAYAAYKSSDLNVKD